MKVNNRWVCLCPKIKRTRYQLPGFDAFKKMFFFVCVQYFVYVCHSLETRSRPMKQRVQMDNTECR